MNSLSNNNPSVKKYSSSDISLEEQQEWFSLKSPPDMIQTMDDGKIITIYLTEHKSFYCWRKILNIEGYMHQQDILINVVAQKINKPDVTTLEHQVSKEPKRFEKFFVAIIRGYTGIKITKELISKFNEQEEEILKKYNLAKRIFEDYLDEVLNLLEESL